MQHLRAVMWFSTVVIKTADCTGSHPFLAASSRTTCTLAKGANFENESKLLTENWCSWVSFYLENNFQPKEKKKKKLCWLCWDCRCCVLFRPPYNSTVKCKYCIQFQIALQLNDWREEHDVSLYFGIETN